MKEYCIYMHICPNGKIYVGQTCEKDPKNRWKNGLGYKRQNYFYNAIKKYGWNNIEHRIISIGIDKEEADFQEMFYISAYRTNEIEFGYNLTNGGEGCLGYNHSNETKQLISRAKTGVKKTEEIKKKISKTKKGKYKGEKAPMYNKHHSEETKQKISDGHKGKHCSPNTEFSSTKYKWLTPDGEIKEMNKSNVLRWHRDWKLMEE